MTSIARTVHEMIAHAKRLIMAPKKTKLDQSPHTAPKESVSSQQMRLEVGARSETGYVRDENQDRMSGSQTPLGQLYIVADGMGGHKGGAVAAELTVQGLLQYIGAAQPNAVVNEVLQAAFVKTNETVYQQAHSGDPSTEGMGSTAVLALVSGQVAWIAHVGDSRAYLCRNNRLRQLTTDHTVVQKMVQAGILTAEEARDHPESSRLERAVGNKPSVEVDILDNLLLNEGDAILLCSDGLSGYVVDAEIESVLCSQATVQEIPERLVELALQKGGEDNVTVQFIQYGMRQEAQPRRTKELEKPALVKATQGWRPSRQLAVALILVLGVAISAIEFYKYPQVQPSNVRAELNNKRQNPKVPAAAAEQSDKATVDNLQKELSSVQSKGEDLQKQVADAKTIVDNLQKELSSVQSKGEDLQKQVANAKTIVDNLQKDLDKAKRKEAALQKQVADAKTAVDDLQKELGGTQSKGKDLQKQVADAKTIVDNLQKDLDEAKRKEAALQKQVGDAKAEVGKSKEESKAAEEQKVNKSPTESEGTKKSEAPGESAAPPPDTESRKQ